MTNVRGLSSLAQRMEQAQLWREGARVLAACSGGPDSMALLMVLDELRRAGRVDVVAAHVHHGLRGFDADEDLRHVADIARRLDIPFRERHGDAAAERTRRRRGLEEAARLVRREALEDMRLEAACDVVALAHTADDQAETLLLWLLRGAGPDGLSGMPARRDSFVRPLLGLRRAELRRALVAAGIPWRSDATNWAPTAARALVRELVERLEISFNDHLVDRLAETAALIREESAWVEAQAEAAGKGLLRPAGGDDGPGPSPRLLAGRHLAALPPVVARRLVRRFLRAARPGRPAPSLDATRRVLALGLDETGACRAAHVSGAIIRRIGDVLVTGPEIAWRPPTVPLALPVPGRTRWGPDGVVVAECVDGAIPPADDLPDMGGGHRRHAFVDAARIPAPLAVRARRPGDECLLPGGGKPRRMGEVLAAIGVPPGLRDRHPLVCGGPDGATVVWVIGHAPSPDVQITTATSRILRLEWQPTERPSPRGDTGRSSP